MIGLFDGARMRAVTAHRRQLPLRRHIVSYQ